MPGCIDEAHITVLAPVAPVPSAMTLCCETTRLYLPHIQIAAHGGIHLAYGGRIGCVHIIVPEAVQTYAGQHLGRKLRVIIAGNGAMDDARIILEGTQLQDALAHKIMYARTICIEALAHQHRHITPPLCSLAVGTIHVIIAHCDIECALRFFPKRVQIAVITLETSGKRAVVTRFVVCKRNYFNSRRNCVYNFVSVHPTKIFVFLFSVLGNVFREHVNLAVWRGSSIIVGTDVYLFAGRSLNFQNRSELTVVRKGADNFVSLATL